MKTLLLASVASTTVWATVGACTSYESHPPPLGGCMAVDGATCAPSVVGGGGGGGGGVGTDAAVGACSIDPNASECDRCAATSCCSPLKACTSLLACEDLMSCVFNCPTGGGVSACEQQFPTATLPYHSLTSCLSISCPVCSESGAGDPCNPKQCVPGAGLACDGLWCTKPCLRNSDCTGIGPGGANIIGEPNACVFTSGGPQCAPGCSTSAQCVAFPGTYCHTTLSAEGPAVQVCATLPDATFD